MRHARRGRRARARGWVRAAGLGLASAALAGWGAFACSEGPAATSTGPGGGGEDGAGASGGATSSTSGTTAFASSTGALSSAGAGPGCGGDAGGATWNQDCDSTWQPVLWPAPAKVEFADSPALAMPPLHWIPCEDAPGCSQVEIVWEPIGAFPITVVSVIRRAEGYFAGVLLRLHEGEFRSAVYGPDGLPIAAWRTGSDGVLVTPHVTEDVVYFGLQHGSEPSVYVAAPYDGLTKASEPIPAKVVSQRRMATSKLLAFELLGGSIAAAYDRAANETRLFQPSGSDLAFVPMAVHDRHLFLLRVYGYDRSDLWAWSTGQLAPTALVHPSGETVMDAKTDGETIVWLQAPFKPDGEPFWTNVQMYTSPFSTTQAGIAPKKLRKAPDLSGVVSTAGGGHYVLYEWETKSMHVYRLSDGRHWSFPVPTLLHGLPYVDEEAVWFTTGGSFYRQRIDALGPGDLPPGAP